MAPPQRRWPVRLRLLLLLLIELLLPRPPPPVLALSDDEACLSNLLGGLADPNNNLRNWTAANVAAPCNGFTSYLQGAVTCNNGRVYKLTLSGLDLGGVISPFVSNCSNLQTLDLSANQISGPIPPELYALNLAVLNLSSNRLTGPIPPQLALCAYLNVIDLHSNLLSGPIPDNLGLLVRLSAFDVSYNRLEGPIPVLLANRSGMASSLPRFNASSFVGNRDLFGYPLPPMRSRGLSVLSIVGIGLGSGLLSLVLSFSAVCIWLRITEQAAVLGGEEGKVSHLMPDY